MDTPVKSPYEESSSESDEESFSIANESSITAEDRAEILSSSNIVDNRHYFRDMRKRSREDEYSVILERRKQAFKCFGKTIYQNAKDDEVRVDEEEQDGVEEPVRILYFSEKGVPPERISMKIRRFSTVESFLIALRDKFNCALIVKYALNEGDAFVPLDDMDDEIWETFVPFEIKVRRYDV